jgi:hypothetical protein
MSTSATEKTGAAAVNTFVTVVSMSTQELPSVTE